MTLAELTARLRDFADGELSLGDLRVSLLPALEADPLDVELSDATPWDRSPDDTRLFWRLMHHFDGGAFGTTSDAREEPLLRRAAHHLVQAMDDAGGAATLELLPVLLDQDRLCTILRKHAEGIISRTGLLSVIAESGYPAHIKLWLQHAGPDALALLRERLESGCYARVAAMVERAP